MVARDVPPYHVIHGGNQMRLGTVHSIAVLLAVVAAGCAGAQVTSQTAQAPISSGRPDAIVIYPFAVTPSEVTLNQGFFQVAYRNWSGTDQTADQLQIADQTAQNICVKVAANLTQQGITATCQSRGVAPAGNNVLIVDGEFTNINEGNRLRRMVIGLGAGQSTLDTTVQTYQKTNQATRQLMEFTTHADSGYMPGAGITGPAGAAAGGATAAATLGVNVAAGGVKSVTSSTGFLADKTAKQITDQISGYYSNQGWRA
jgi:Domain of unknown function (DUF4410)